MKFEDFEAIINAYGASEMRWPESKRQEMTRLIKTHPEQASALLDNARILDAALDSLPAPQASDLLKTRIQKSVMNNARTPEVRTSSTQNWRRLAAMIAVSFSAGFAGAQFVELPQEISAPTTEMVVSSDSEWELVATELGFTDIYEWTSGEELDLAISDL